MAALLRGPSRGCLTGEASRASFTTVLTGPFSCFALAVFVRGPDPVFMDSTGGLRTQRILEGTELPPMRLLRE